MQIGFGHDVWINTFISSARCFKILLFLAPLISLIWGKITRQLSGRTCLYYLLDFKIKQFHKLVFLYFQPGWIVQLVRFQLGWFFDLGENQLSWKLSNEILVWLSPSYQTNHNIDLTSTTNQNDSTRLKTI